MTNNIEFIWEFGRERGTPISQLTHRYLINFVNKVSDVIAGEEHHKQARAELQRRADRRGEHQQRTPQGMPPGGYPEECGSE